MEMEYVKYLLFDSTCPECQCRKNNLPRCPDFSSLCSHKLWTRPLLRAMFLRLQHRPVRAAKSSR